MNNSFSHEYEVHDGVENLSEWCAIKKWNNFEKLEIWESDSANKIYGTDGNGFSPMLERDQNLNFFLESMCRSFPLEPIETKSNLWVSS